MRIFPVPILLFYIFCCAGNCAAQQANTKVSILGKWTCVLLDKRGYQKFSYADAKKLQHSILTITKDSIFYDKVPFVEPCKYDHFKISHWDTTESQGHSLEFKYYKKELYNLMNYAPVDSSGEWACYNECSIFYMKQDTLINICGGYALYFTRLKKGKHAQR